MPAGAAAPAELLDAGGRTVRLSSPERVLFPATGFTKRDLASYYLAVAPAILPHLARRPVTLARFPDGVHGPGFFQANCPPGRPDWLPVVELAGTRGQPLRYCLVEEPAALAWLANRATVELHPFRFRVDAPGAPRELVLDLDPGPPAGLAACCAVALALRARLAEDGLAAFPKLSGASGLHVVVPLDGTVGFDRAKQFVRGLAAELARREPERVVDRAARVDRAGRVFVDWAQNTPGRSTVAAWSLRAGPVPLVAAPLAWEEVHAGARGATAALRIGPAEALARLAHHGDLHAPALGLAQRI
jgi:bifunctional non-homologous end joining protein LigD